MPMNSLIKIYKDGDKNNIDSVQTLFLGNLIINFLGNNVDKNIKKYDNLVVLKKTTK